ncbi:MAG: hypothetical protein MUP76_04080 [Acidimicrobiia bacterium]|nr:hypothetical protein [Acidimicrobiia bacterium]
MDFDALLLHRAEHDRFLGEHYASPLPEEHQAGFEGLDYFQPDASWAMIGTWEATDPVDVPIRSSGGTESSYTQVGFGDVAAARTCPAVASLWDAALADGCGGALSGRGRVR